MNYSDIWTTLDNIINDCDYARFYTRIKRKTTEDKIKFYALVILDEFEFDYKTDIRVFHLENMPDENECLKIIARWYLKYKKDPEHFFRSVIEPRNRRLAKYQSPRYKRLYDTFSRIFPEKRCFNCGCKGVQLDHIVDCHHRPELTYDLNNLQWLCTEENSVKTASTSDHRKQEHLDRIATFIEEELAGESLVY